MAEERDHGEVAAEVDLISDRGPVEAWVRRALAVRVG